MIRFADNFAMYGTGNSAAVNEMVGGGLYAEVSSTSNLGPSTANPRGLGTHHWRSPAANMTPLRLALGGTYTTFFLAGAFYFHSLPGNDTATYLFQVRDGANAAQLTIIVTPTGDIHVKNGTGSGTVIAQTASPALTAGAYHYVECKIDMGQGSSPADGAVEIRVNGEIVINEDSIDTQGTANAGAQIITIANTQTSGGAQIDLADFVFYDTTGSVNNDFLGDTQWLRLDPNADTVESDWARNTGANDYEAIDDTSADGDTTYIEATTPGDVSSFGLGNLAATVSEVVAVIARVKSRKTDAGDANLQVSIRSALASPNTEDAGADNPLTEAYTYRDDIFETDPATSALWVPASVDAAQLKFDRTA